jgi:hypothetical protein
MDKNKQNLAEAAYKALGTLYLPIEGLKHWKIRARLLDYKKLDDMADRIRANPILGGEDWTLEDNTILRFKLLLRDLQKSSRESTFEDLVDRANQ